MLSLRPLQPGFRRSAPTRCSRWLTGLQPLRRVASRSLAGVLGVLASCAALGCSSAGDQADGGAPVVSEIDRARALLEHGSALPVRAEVVALADHVAVAASREASVDEQARLYRLAADLRARVWRFDRAEADAREALELYSASAKAARGKESACEADRARAHLAAELAQDAGAAYRALYLVRRRHAALAPEGQASGSGRLEHRESACLTLVARDLAMGQAYRPSGPELAALEREGDRAALTARAPASPASADVSAAAPGAALGPRQDVVVAPEPATSKGPVKVTKIDKYPAEGGGRIVVHVSASTSFKVGELQATGDKDARVFLDIDRASVKGVAREIEVGGGIKRIRTAPRDDGARIVLDLADKMHRRVFYLPQPFRIVVDVSARPPGAARASGAGPRTVKRVALDPGHGGTDAGAVGPTGLKEKDVALDIAHRVAPLLADELKIETMLTRDTDVFVPLDERAARANAFHADLFVSIHCNASETGEARGIEVFILDAVKDTARAAARITALENGLGLSGALDSAALDAEMASIATRLGSGQIAESSRTLGLLLGKATLASVGQKYPDTHDHGLKSAGFYVLAGAEMPAVLFETSFISNPDDEARLAKADYKQKLADGVVNAIRAYRDGK